MVDATSAVAAPPAGRRPAGRALSVLAVTSELPWPLNTGGHLRSFHLLRALAAQSHLRLVVPLRPGEEGAAESLRGAGIDLRAVPVGRRRAWREALRVAASAVRGQPYVLYRRHSDRAVRGVLDNELRRDPPDVLYLDHLDPLSLWPARPAGRFVVDLHNVYSTLLARTALEKRGPARLYLRREAALLDRAERRAAAQADALFCVSDEDAEHFRRAGGRSVHVVPNGVDCSAFAGLPAGRREGPPVLLYLGAMSWAPNAAAARFLATEVMPKVRARLPEARLRVVGRDPGSDVLALARLPGVEVTGTVPSIVPHLAEAHALAVPLEAGGGTRLKILEAFAAGLPVVSTAVGCEGLRVAHGEHLHVSARERFADALLALLTDPALGEAMAARARRLVREQYDWDAISARACGLLAGLAG